MSRLSTRLTSAKTTLFPPSNTLPLDTVLPGAPVGLAVNGANGRFIADWALPATGVATWDDVVIQYATDSGFTAGVITAPDWGPILHGEGTDPNKTYYFRVALHNKSTVASDATVKAAIEATGRSGGRVDYGWGPFCAGVGPVSSGNISIADGQIAAAKFASGIRPVGVGASLPVAGMAEGDTFLLTTDGKLYRYHNSAWTKATDGADIIANSIVVGALAAGIMDSFLITSPNVQTSANNPKCTFDSTGLHMFDASGNELVRIKNDATFWLKSAASGTRVEIDTTGAHFYNSYNVKVVDIPTGGAPVFNGFYANTGSPFASLFFSDPTQYMSVTVNSSEVLRVGVGTGGLTLLAGNISLSGAGATVDGVDVSAHAAATTSAHGGIVASTDSRLSDSRPASDVYSWAKAASKPSYSASEVGANPATPAALTAPVTWSGKAAGWYLVNDGGTYYQVYFDGGNRFSVGPCAINAY